MLKGYFIGAIVATTVMSGAAHAAPLYGTYTIDIYNYDSLGNSSNADASAVNVGANTLTGSISYTGNLDFFTSTGTTPTIGEFLNSGGGTIIGGNAGLFATVMSIGGFTTTTLLDIYGTFASAVTGTIDHDDGVTLYDSTTAIVLNSAAPTSPITSPFAAQAGAFRLIYSAANGNPEELRVDVAAVPVPAAGLMLLGALGGLGAMRRRKAVV